MTIESVASPHAVITNHDISRAGDGSAALSEQVAATADKMRADADLSSPASRSAISAQDRDITGRAPATVPLEIHDGGTVLASGGRAAAAGDGAQPVKAAADPHAAEASASAGDTERELEAARTQFGKAQTPEEKEAALKNFQSIIASADKNATGLQEAVAKEANRISPGASDAARDLNSAVTKLAQEQSKLSPEQVEKISGDLEKWSSGTPAVKATVEGKLRAQGLKPLADAMAGCDKVQRDHADVFKRGEQTEDYINSHFGQAMADTLKARLDAREDYRLALGIAGRSGDEARVAREEEAIIADAHHTIETSRVGN